MAAYEDRDMHYALSPGADPPKIVLICSIGGKALE